MNPGVDLVRMQYPLINVQDVKVVPSNSVIYQIGPLQYIPTSGFYDLPIKTDRRVEQVSNPVFINAGIQNGTQFYQMAQPYQGEYVPDQRGYGVPMQYPAGYGGIVAPGYVGPSQIEVPQNFNAVPVEAANFIGNEIVPAERSETPDYEEDEEEETNTEETPNMYNVVPIEMPAEQQMNYVGNGILDPNYIQSSYVRNPELQNYVQNPIQMPELAQPQLCTNYIGNQSNFSNAPQIRPSENYQLRNPPIEPNFIDRNFCPPTQMPYNPSSYISNETEYVEDNFRYQNSEFEEPSFEVPARPEDVLYRLQNDSDDSHEPIMSTKSAKSFSCRFCEKSFVYVRNLNKHMSKHHNVPCEPYKSSESPELVVEPTPVPIMCPKSKVFKCKVCDETFEQVTKLRRHEFEHTNEKPFICKYCDKSFSQALILIQHVQINHPENI